MWSNHTAARITSVDTHPTDTASEGGGGNATKMHEQPDVS
jgi:hypothetical protein